VQEGPDLLASVCGRFTEGFGAADLPIAKQLRYELTYFKITCGSAISTRIGAGRRAPEGHTAPDEDKYITATELVVDGGLTVHCV
jgi:hypothetical protein